MSSPGLCDSRTESNAAESITVADLINAAEVLIAENGLGALTMRDLSIATGSSSVRIREMCGSRAALIGHTWLRASRRLLTVLTSLVDETCGDPWEKAFAAAEASVLYPRQYPRSAALLAVVSHQDLVRRPLPADIAHQLQRLDEDFVQVMRRLSVAVWNRDDADAVDLISSCVIDLPKRILRRPGRYRGYFVREYLREAVRGVLACGPPTVASIGAVGLQTAGAPQTHRY